MSKRTAFVVLAAVVLAGCGPQKPAEATKPAEPAFTAMLETLEPMTVACVEKTGPYAGIRDAFAALTAWATGKNVEPGKTFGVYHNSPSSVPQESLRWDVCMVVPAGTRADRQAGVMVKEMPATAVASTIHVGAPSAVGATYARLMPWIAGQNMDIAGPSMEFYGDMCVSEDSMRIKVAFPVAPRIPAPGDTSAGAARPPTRTGR